MDLIQQFPNAAPFVMAGNDQAILMIHGFTSTPNVFRQLAHRLSNSMGWEIHVPLLPGHGLTPEQLDHATHEQWISFCENQLLELSTRFRNIHLVGLSMGGTLCAHLAVKNPNLIQSVTLLSPAMFVRDFISRFLLSIVRFLPNAILLKWILKKDVGPNLDPVSYHRYSAKSTIEFDSVCRFVKKEFKTHKPCLVMVPTQDETIHPKSSTWFYKRSENPKTKLIKLEQSPHLVFLGKENELIFSEIEKFLFGFS